jgi:protein-S-isoprenylcysteine O-methyltransferase Ste14
MSPDTSILIIVIYFIAIAIYGIMEIYLQLRFSKWKLKRTRDKGLISIMVPFYLAIYLAPFENILLKKNLYIITIAIGFSILVTGVILRLLALLKLRENFSMVVESGDKDSLIVDGPYRYIRHPLYLATLFIALSGCIIFTCMVTWIFFVLTWVSILRRIKVEEAYLISAFQGYEAYMYHTKKLIPFLY